MRILKIVCCLFILSFFIAPVYAQEEKPYKEPTGLNNWYVELGGAAMFYSLNYEKVLHKGTKTGVVGRVGLGYNWGDYTFLNKVYLDANTFMVPFTGSFLYGGGKEKLEVGLGFTLLAKDIKDRETVPTAVFGFRVVETNKICFRISYTPFIRDNKYVSWFGVSLGRNFSFK